MHQNYTDAQLVETWTKGWSLARDVALPVREGEGFRVEVGWPQQVARYVFPRLCNSYLQLAATITEPWHFLKVCAAPQDVQHLLPARWVVQPVGFMMTCFHTMQPTKTHLPQGYRLERQEDLPVPIVRVLTQTGEVAAIGRIALVDGFAIYDRIETHPAHRRQGLASVVMHTLEQISIARGYAKGILVATAAGKALYETLGWQLFSLYTTAVIPGAVQ